MSEILLKYFSGLSSEEKREEVMRLLPAITSFERNFNEVRDEIDASLNRLERENLIKRWGGFFNDNFVGWSLYPQVQNKSIIRELTIIPLARKSHFQSADVMQWWDLSSSAMTFCGKFSHKTKTSMLHRFPTDDSDGSFKSQSFARYVL